MVLAHKYAPKAVYGIIRSHDGFYMDDNAEQEAFWSEKGIVGAGMESSTLLTIDRQRGMETLSILNNVVLYEGDLFYVISQPIGWFMWGHDDATKRFSPQARRWVFAGVVVAYFIGWYVIGLFHGQLPCFDSFNLVVSFISLNTRKTGHYGFGLIQQTLFTGLFWQFVSKWVFTLGLSGATYRKSPYKQPYYLIPFMQPKYGLVVKLIMKEVQQINEELQKMSTYLWDCFRFSWDWGSN